MPIHQPPIHQPPIHQPTNSPTHEVIIVGGGITGLTAAYDLRQRGVNVVVLEASSRAGGLIQTDRVEGFTIEAGPDSLLASKPAALHLVEELGLRERVQTVRPPGRAFVLRGHRLYRLPSPSLLGLPLSLTALATYHLLPLGARLRLALEPLIPAKRATDHTDRVRATDHTDRVRATDHADHVRATDHTDHVRVTDHADLRTTARRESEVGGWELSEGDESVASFFCRRFGAATVDLIAQPLLGGIHAGDIEQLSMRALFPRLLALEERYGSVLHGAKRELNSPEHQSANSPRHQATNSRTSPFVTLRGGMGTLVDALVERLGPALQLNSPVERIERETNGWRVGSHRARAVLIAAPAAVAARLLAPIDAEAARLCAATPYVSTASIALAWPRDAVPHPLDGTGFVVARRHSDVRITACTWVSQKWDERAPEGFVLMRAFIGGAHDPGAVDLEDEELVAVARRDLGAVLGVTAAPLLARVHRWRDAGAQHLLGQLARMDRLDARLAAHAGLRVAGSGFRAVGIPDCVADARRAAAAILG